MTLGACTLMHRLLKIGAHHSVISCSVILQNRYVLLYANRSIIWNAKLDIEIVLRTNESEYTALLQFVRGLNKLIKGLQSVIHSEGPQPEDK